MRCWLDTLSLVPHVPWLLKPSLLGCLGYRYIPHLAADPGALQCVFLLSQDLNSLGTLPPPSRRLWLYRTLSVWKQPQEFAGTRSIPVSESGLSKRMHSLSVH